MAEVSLNTPASRAEQLQEDLFYASRARALYWAQIKFKWQPKAFYQILLLGCLDRLYRYPEDYPIEKLRGKEIKRFAWRIGRQCIPQGTIIHTRDGKVLPIEEHPDAFPTKKNATIYNIETDGGYSIRCTGNHPISAKGKDLEFVRADELQVGDEVEVLTEFDRWGNGHVPYAYRRFVTAGRKADGTRWEKHDDVTGIYEMNEELAELLGLFVADGNYNSSGKDGSLYFTNTDETYLQRFEYLIAKHFPDVQTTRYQKARVGRKNGDGQQKLAYDVMVAPAVKGAAARGKNSFKNFLHAMNFHPCGFPRAVAEHFTREQVIAFLRGVWMGDGCFYASETNTIEGTLACGLSRTYAEYFQNIFGKFGIVLKIESQVMKLSTAAFWKLRFRNSFMYEKFYNVIGAIPGKTFEITKKYPHFKRYTDIATQSYTDGEVTQFCAIKRISIEEERQDCWDVEVENKGWFISSLHRVSNSGKTECLALAALYLGICKPITEHEWVSKRYGDKVKKEKIPFKRGAKIIMASADADKAKTVFDRVMKFLNDCPEYAIAMEQNVIKVKKHPFPSIEINVPTWKHPAEIVFRGPGAKGQALRSKTFDYKLYDEADYMPDSFFDAELATEINAKDQTTGESNAFIILSSTPSGRRAKFYEACFHGEAKVALADGSLKAIKDVVKGEKVYNRYGVPEPVTKVMNRPYKGEIVEFRVAGLPDYVVGTALHKVMSVARSDHFCQSCRQMVWTAGTTCPFYGDHSQIKGPIAVYSRLNRLNCGDLVVIPRALADKYVNWDEIEAKFSHIAHKTDDFVYLPVVHHETRDEELTVYNLTVGFDHSYTVNCIGVANCTDQKLGFKEFWFPSWENPNYDEETDRYFRGRMTQTVYDHEIMADWGTVESGVFDWTYFQHVFAYKYKNNKSIGQYEYRYISLNANDVKQIGMQNIASYITRRLPEKKPLAKYWFGADLGYSADPSEFVIFEEFNGVLKMVARLHLEHIDYTFQADMVALLDNYYKFEQLGMDEGGNGRTVCQLLMSNSQGWNKFAAHRFDKRLTPIPFGGMLVIDKLNGKEIKEPSKKAMTEMIKKQAEMGLLVMPGLDFDADIENQFRNHTYSMGANGQPVYSKGSVSPDHVVDAVRTAFYARAYAAMFRRNSELPRPSSFHAPRW